MNNDNEKESLNSEQSGLKVTFHQSYQYFLDYHGHDFFELFLVCKGTYSHNFNGKKTMVKTGDGYLIRPCDKHAITPMEKDSTCLFVTVSIDNMKKACAAFSNTLYDDLFKKDALILFLSDYDIKQIMDLCFYIQTELGKGNKDLELPASLLLMEVLSQTIRQNFIFDEKKPEWLNDLIKEIQAPENKDWKVKDVMNHANYSHSHVSRIFNQYMGCSIIYYLTEIKMQKARDFLMYSDMAIYEISTSLGYKSPTNFSAVFKEHFNLSPVMYRKKMRKKQEGKEELKNL